MESDSVYINLKFADPFEKCCLKISRIQPLSAEKLKMIYPLATGALKYNSNGKIKM